METAHADERGALSVEEFAKSHGLSRAYIYQLWHEGRGPRVMRVGRRTLISREAAAEWRRMMEYQSESVQGGRSA